MMAMNFIGAFQYLSQPVATRLTAMAAFKNDSLLYLIHIDGDDSDEGSRCKNIFDNVFGLVRVVKFLLDSQNSLFLVVQVYSRFVASAFGIALSLFTHGRAFTVFGNILIIGLRGSVPIYICISSVKRQANLPTS